MADKEFQTSNLPGVMKGNAIYKTEKDRIFADSRKYIGMQFCFVPPPPPEPVLVLKGESPFCASVRRSKEE